MAYLYMTSYTKRFCLRMMGVVFYIGDYLGAIGFVYRIFIVDLKKINKAD
jgi:hypothetical protein